MSRALIIFFLFLGVPHLARAQVFLASGGTSTILNATGGQVTMYNANSTTSVALGEYAGHFIIGAADYRIIDGWDVTTGSGSFGISGGSFGVSTQELGISVRREDKIKHRKFGAFVGMTGPLYQSLFFYGSGMPSNPGAGVFFEQTTGHFTFDSVAMIVHQPIFLSTGVTGRAQSVATILESVKYDRHWLVLNADTGELQNQFIWTGSASVQTKHVGGNVTDQILLLDGTRASFENESAFFNEPRWGASAGMVQSKAGMIQSQGEFLTGHATILDGGRLTVSSEYFRSGRTLPTWTNSVSERFHRKFYVSESVTRSGSQETLDASGGYAGNVLSVDISHSELYYPLLANPWKRTLTISVGLRLPHQSQVMVNTLAAPGGGLKWGASASRYIYHDTDPSMSEHASIGKYEICGSVVDITGKSVSGAALKINGREVFSDDGGHFSARFGKNKDFAIVVVVDEFLEGKWTVKSAPTTASPGIPVEVIVVRQ